MEKVFLEELREKLQKTLKQSKIPYGKVGFINEKKSLHFIGWKCKECEYCRNLVCQKVDNYFENRGCFPRRIKTCLGIPVVYGEDGVGIVIIGIATSDTETVILDKVRNIFRKIARFSAIYYQREQIRKLSIEKWGEGKAIVFVGNSPKYLEAQNKIARFARSKNPVVIMGESGVGKELFAKSIYLLSRRITRPFISVNCAQYQDRNLMVTDLFGHKRGSFTGAVADHLGIFEEVNGGMVFLDEIGELTPEAQGMLLRVLSEGEIRPLGENRNKPVDVQVIAATNCNLEQMVESGKFRRDLYFRLYSLHVRIPSLRERGEDWKILLNHFLNELNEEYGVKKHFSKSALAFLENYPWSGNIRELMSIVSMAFFVSDEDEIKLQDLKLQESRREREDKIDDLPDALEYYRRIVEDGESFWDVVKTPFMKRELNRSEVKRIIRLGLNLSRGRYKELLKIFNISEKDYKRFLNFIWQKDLRP
jgi:DNA-binding NtrC family response regulator